MTTQTEFDALVAARMRQFPDWRYGQTLFNVAVELQLFTPTEIDELVGTDHDPFHVVDDKRRIDNFMKLVSQKLDVPSF